MTISTSRAREALRNFDFEALFIEELGWDYHPSQQPLPVTVDGVTYDLDSVAEKRGMSVYLCSSGVDGEVPEYALRKRIERQVAKSAYEHIIVYVDEGRSVQVWQWVLKEPGRPVTYREQKYHKGQLGEHLIQRLNALVIDIDEEDDITIVDVSGRVRAAFDVEALTKKFYKKFQDEHGKFLAFLDGIFEQGDREWYASLMLNRLMFVYFIQKKGFLDGDQDYLKNRLKRTQEREGEGKFLGFYRYFLLRLFHEGLAKEPKHRPGEADELLGEIPYLNGGLFEVHELEREYPDIHIPDQAFEDVFGFFDGYRWHLDERPLRDDNEINPEVLGYIFEKYINQKQMGAYYTKEDVTGYIGENAIIPYLFDAAEEDCAVAFRPDGAMWNLLTEDPDRYIYSAVKKGVVEDGKYISLPDEIRAGINEVSDRGVWNCPADDRYALPTETWREHVARRVRCEDLRDKLSSGDVVSINDLVTLNLDIRQFAQDAIENCEGPELLRAFYQAIRNIRVLDPTCGSGAFLFATLNILEPLYEACLERMERFMEEDTSGERYSDFRDMLTDVEKHPNRRYFVLKTIMVSNLYGVDIMEEAVEIARLRLFLKLMAQLGSVDEIEPLPDIDFNLRAGNSLIGFANIDEVERTLQKKLDLGGSKAKIEEEATAVKDALLKFQRMQMDEAADSEDFREAKAELREKIEGLNEQLDSYIATEYGIEPDRVDAFEAWRESHQPFHWLIVFYEIMQSGGFDVVVGNPPYVEISKVKEYSPSGYVTEKCGNLYALCVERFSELLCTGGKLGVIVPLSGFSTKRMTSYQDYLYSHYKCLHISYYSGDAHPSTMFSGVKYRLSIILGTFALHGRPTIYTSSYLRWYAKERPHLFQRVTYARCDHSKGFLRYAKLGNAISAKVFQKLLQKTAPLGAMLATAGNGHVNYHRSPVFWIRSMDFEPYFNSATRDRSLDHLRDLYTPTEQQAKTVGAILNSTCFYYWFCVQGNCRNIAGGDVDSYPSGTPAKSTMSELIRVFAVLMSSLQTHSRRRVYNYKHSGRVEYDEFYPSQSKPVIDNLDRVLAEHYGFTEEELDFIINYDIKYRMGATS